MRSALVASGDFNAKTLLRPWLPDYVVDDEQAAAGSQADDANADFDFSAVTWASPTEQDMTELAMLSSLMQQNSSVSVSDGSDPVDVTVPFDEDREWV